MSAPWFWYYGTDTESLSGGPCDTRDQAIIGGVNDFDGAPFYIVHATMGAPLRLSDTIDADTVDRMIECATENDWFDRSDPDGVELKTTPEDVADLVARLRAAVRAWEVEREICVLNVVMFEDSGAEELITPIIERAQP